MSAGKANVAYQGVGGEVRKVSHILPALGPNQILVKITHTGLCGTDLHAIFF